MVKGGKGGANTQSGLAFEGKTDLATFLSKQRNYTVKNENVYHKNKLVARIFKKHKFYNVFLKELNIDWERYISKPLFPDDSIYVLVNNTLHIIECKH